MSSNRAAEDFDEEALSLLQRYGAPLELNQLAEFLNQSAHELFAATEKTNHALACKWFDLILLHRCLFNRVVACSIAQRENDKDFLSRAVYDMATRHIKTINELEKAPHKKLIKRNLNRKNINTEMFPEAYRKFRGEGHKKMEAKRLAGEAVGVKTSQANTYWKNAVRDGKLSPKE